MTTASQVVRSYVKTHYGELMNTEEPVFNEETRTYEAELVSYYPRIINDDATPENSTVKFLYLKKLGKIELDSSLNIVSATSRAEASDLLGDRFSLFRQRAERIMVEASAAQIAGLTDAKHVLAPVIKVIDNLLDHEAKIPEISDSDFGDDETVNRYWKLMEDTGIIMRVEGGWNSGKNFVDIFTHYRSNYDALVSKTLALIIREKYASLRSAFDISELEPAIHVDNSYYWPALEADKPILQKTESLRDRHNASYRAFMSVGRFKYYLQQLFHVQAIAKESGCWVAARGLFDNMREIRGTQLEPSSLRV